MNWIYLIIGGIFEVVFTFCLGKMKDASGNAKIWWIGIFVVALSTSMTLLWKATQTLPIGTAYAVWTGIGAVGTVLMGIILFNEPASFWRLIFIMTLVVSIIGLKVVSH
jgi:quaternary ammonium compound-resistance protein SugE